MKPTTAKVVMYCSTIVVVGVAFWHAPEQAVEMFKTGALVLGGIFAGPKIATKTQLWE